jgi:hypothetical protein
MSEFYEELDDAEIAAELKDAADFMEGHYESTPENWPDLLRMAAERLLA